MKPIPFAGYDPSENRLPFRTEARQRQILRMFRDQKMDTLDIAHKLGMREPRVCRLLHDAMDRVWLERGHP